MLLFQHKKTLKTLKLDSLSKFTKIHSFDHIFGLFLKDSTTMAHRKHQRDVES
jgi:hypothetical protein